MGVELMATEEPDEWKPSRPDLWGGRRVTGALTRNPDPNHAGHIGSVLSTESWPVMAGVTFHMRRPIYSSLTQDPV